MSTSMPQWFKGQPELVEGDLVATPYGDARVVEVVAPTDTFLAENLESGIVLEWQTVEVETLALPDPHDTAAVERWLALAAIVVPSVAVDTSTVRCQTDLCDCQWCYRIVKAISGRGIADRTEVTHMVDSPACPCQGGGVVRASCGCLNDVTVRFAGFYAGGGA